MSDTTTTTLERYLGKFKKILAEYELNLQGSPIEITGDEVAIRLFFYNFLFGATEFGYFINITNELNETYNAIILYIEQTTHLSLTVKRNSILYWMAIINQRIAAEKYVFLEPSVTEKRPKKEEQEYYLTIWEILDYECPEKYKPSELAFLSLVHRRDSYFAQTPIPAKDYNLSDMNTLFQNILTAFDFCEQERVYNILCKFQNGIIK